MSTPDREVWKIEALPCDPGDRWTICFESTDDAWRHGVLLGVNGGELEVRDYRASQILLWSDTAPVETQVAVLSCDDGLLRLYNVWDSGRGLGRFESQKATSGMVREPIDRGFRYRCSAISAGPAFDQLVFTATRS